MYPSPTKAVMAGVTPAVEHPRHSFEPIKARGTSDKGCAHVPPLSHVHAPPLLPAVEGRERALPMLPIPRGRTLRHQIQAAEQAHSATPGSRNGTATAISPLTVAPRSLYVLGLVPLDPVIKPRSVYGPTRAEFQGELPGNFTTLTARLPPHPTRLNCAIFWPSI